MGNNYMKNLSELLSQQQFKVVNGIWYSSQIIDISYPDKGHDACFEVEETSFWFKHRNECILKCFHNYSKENFLLEVGGGNGFITKTLQDNNIHSILLEPGKSGVLNAQRRGVNHIICGTMSDLTFLEGQVDTIGAFDVLEHIEDDEMFLSEVYSLLSDNGKFYITVPAFQSLWSSDDDYSGHYRRYTLELLEQKLKLLGFEIEYSTYFFSILFLPLFFIRTLPSLVGFRKNVEVISKKEHINNKGFWGRMFDFYWSFELKMIEKNKRLPFGTSCIVIAKKNVNDTLQ